MASSQRSVAELYGRLHGHTVIVVGGGPSAPAQFVTARHSYPFARVISANAHAFKLTNTVDFIMCKDHTHTETGALMEPALRAHGAPIVSINYWADYRAMQWPIQGNSGMMALGLAALMQAALIIPVGFDCFLNGTYFHAPDAKNVSAGRRPGHWKNRLERLRSRLDGAVIRTVGVQADSVMGSVFAPLVEGKLLPVARVPAVFDRFKDQRTVYVLTLKSFVIPAGPNAGVPAGYTLATTGKEAEQLVRLGVARKLDTFTEPVIPLTAR